MQKLYNILNPCQFSCFIEKKWNFLLIFFTPDYDGTREKLQLVADMYDEQAPQLFLYVKLWEGKTGTNNLPEEPFN